MRGCRYDFESEWGHTHTWCATFAVCNFDWAFARRIPAKCSALVLAFYSPDAQTTIAGSLTLIQPV